MFLPLYGRPIRCSAVVPIDLRERRGWDLQIAPVRHVRFPANIAVALSATRLPAPPLP
jgi:hypothetical protein